MDEFWNEYVVPVLVFAIDAIAYVAKSFIYFVAFIGEYGFYAIIFFAILSAPIAIIVGVLGQARLTIELYRWLVGSICRLSRIGRRKSVPTQNVTIRREPELDRN